MSFPPSYLVDGDLAPRPLVWVLLGAKPYVKDFCRRYDRNTKRLSYFGAIFNDSGIPEC